ncbi:helix-turn-helix domain-containing protein [Streptomyces sp. GMY02]|uniref:AraC-like ligand-binding domain-containing protein n=1 Tax=Streptomyces sp. GMY02 TaxID=1333528 RepID=UPI001C2BB756|nr:helix-turn-helix domain-containing protein [Streptomyces sp. GMY02]QXE38684.1 helix-turn-helix domain-containing protein [Streptomyces sp. GMY02]
MMETVFHSEDLPPAERLARFDAFQGDSLYPIRMESSDRARFSATARALDLATVNVIELTCSPSDVQRTPRLIRRCDPELYSVIFALRGGLGVVRDGQEVELGPFDFALHDSSRPFDMRIAADRGTATLVHALVPRALLPLPADRSAGLIAVPLPGREGVGSLLTQFLTSLTTDSAAYLPADAPRLGTVALDLLTAVLAHHLDADARVPDGSRQRALLLRIEAFVQQHLHDPELSPGSIAAAHHISVSYLHRLFRARDDTVAAWIRGQRLERARRDLTDRTLRTVAVHRIAARWGFPDHTTFTRAFRAAYDLPPRDYRRQALDSPA